MHDLDINAETNFSYQVCSSYEMLKVLNTNVTFMLSEDGKD